MNRNRARFASPVPEYPPRGLRRRQGTPEGVARSALDRFPGWGLVFAGLFAVIGCKALTDVDMTAKLAEDVSAIKTETRITSNRVTNVDEWTERLRSFNEIAQTVGRYWLLIVIASPFITYIGPKLLWHAAQYLGRRGAAGVSNGDKAPPQAS